MKNAIFFLLGSMVSVTGYAQTTYTLKSTCTSAAPCNWDTDASWVGGVAPKGAGPTTGSQIIIPANTQVNIRGGGNKINITNRVDVLVYGVIFFSTNSAELDLQNASSTIQLASGSDLVSTASPSEKVKIGSSSISGTEIDAITTPNQLTQGTLTSGGCAVAGGCNGDPLPIQLISFDAAAAIESVELTWSTASELNFSYFSIQRSSNGKQFTEIAQINGHGTTNVKHDYIWIDEHPLIGKSYYRLTSVDFDGYTESFNIVPVIFSGRKFARIFPNPAVGGRFNIEFAYTPTEPVNIVVTDLSGIEMIRYTIGDQTAELNASLEQGTYLVKISGEGVNDVVRVVVR